MKQVLIVALALLTVTVVNAQRPRTHFGLKAGVNVANIKIENAGEGDSRVGFHAGGLAHIHISKNFAVQPELLFSQQGRRETIAGTKYKTNLSYINLPVLAQYMTGNGFRLQTGPQLGVLLDAETGVDDNMNDITESYKTVDLSWAFGVSYLTTAGIGFDARYNLGLNNINDLSSRNVKNRVFAIGLFYQFMH